jgi:excisionase family DNA binding protein
VNTTSGALTTQAPDVAYLTPKDIQRELRISERSCYRLLQAGSIPSIKVGHLYRIKRSDLEEVLEHGAVLEVRQ